MGLRLFCAAIAVLFASACVPVAYQAVPPVRGERNGDIEISTQSHHDPASREQAAEKCAQYGRVERSRGGNDYDCVAPHLASSN
jgi:hypothetical protein